MAKLLEQESCFPDEVSNLDRAIGAAEKLKIIKNPYTGNKKKIILDIWKILVKENIPTTSILDLFSGSSCFGVFFKYMGSRVLCNDLLSFPYLTSLSLVENSIPRFTVSEMAHFLTDDGLGPGFVSKNYSVNSKASRFTLSESIALDSFYRRLEGTVGSIPKLIEKCSFRPVDFMSKLEDDVYKTSFGLMLVLNHIMTNCHLGGRLNHGQVLAELQFRMDRQKQKINSVDEKYLGEISFSNIFIPDMRFDDPKSCLATRSDAIDLLSMYLPEFDIIYIDPPYGGDQSDYAAMYRFCEEYIWQRPMEEIPFIDFSARFSKSKGYEDQFKLLLSKLPKNCVWVISYNDSSWSNIEKIKEIIFNFRHNVLVKEIDYEYQYRKHDKSSGTEYLIIVR